MTGKQNAKESFVIPYCLFLAVLSSENGHRPALDSRRLLPIVLPEARLLCLELLPLTEV